MNPIKINGEIHEYLRRICSCYFNTEKHRRGKKLNLSYCPSLTDSGNKMIKYVMKKCRQLCCFLIQSDPVDMYDGAAMQKKSYFNFSGPPDNPQLYTNGGSLGKNLYRKGEKLEISCSAPAGRPAANVTLFLGQYIYYLIP